MQNKIVFCLLLITVGVYSCRKDFEGDRGAQQMPETYTLVDSIIRDTNNLLSTTVTASWWGVSKSGFISGYEVSIDNQQTWQYTKAQSGTYLLNLPVGFDKGNLPIYVRAIDNIGQKDPTPAVMVFPVKNTAPTLVFDYLTGRKTVTYPAFRYYWTVADLDGAQDIQGIEMVLNDTNKAPLVMPNSTIAASFVAVYDNGVFDTSCWVYQNSRTIPLPQKLDGVKYNQLNYVFIRSVDRVGAKSAWAIDSITIKKPKSDLLLVNDYSTKGPVQNFYNIQVANLGPAYSNFDSVMSLTDDLPADVFTIVKTFDFYKRIVWYSDNPTSSLGLAQLVTQNFFMQGGRMFMACEIPSDFPYNSGILNFTPVQEMVVPPVGTTLRMNIGEIMYPHVAGNGWPTLKTTAILSSAQPFVTFSQPSGAFTYDSTCRANLLAQTTAGTTTWMGGANVLSKRLKVSTGKPDLLFLTLPLQRLNGNNNIDSFFRQALITELQF